MISTINTEEFDEFEGRTSGTHVLKVLLGGMEHEEMPLLTKERFNKSLTI